MRIRYKLLIAFLLIVGIFAGSGVYTITNVQEMVSHSRAVDKDFSIYQEAKNYEKGSLQVQVGVYLYAHGNTALGDQLIREGTELMRTSRTSMKSIVSDPNLLSDLTDIQRFEEKVIESSLDVKKTVDEPLADEQEQAAKLEIELFNVEGRVQALDLKLSTMVEKTDKDMAATLKGTREQGQESIMATYYAGAAALVIALLLAFLMASQLTKPINKLADIANKVSKGDIYEQVMIKSKDEIGNLAESFKRMINSYKIMEALLKEEN